MPSRQDEFERLAMPHLGGLLGFARRLTRDQAAAEDLVQETMLNAWHAFPRLRDGSNVHAWLFRILLNAFHAHGRKLRSAPQIVPLAEIQDRGREECCLANDIAEAVERLSEEHRTVLWLGVVEGFTCREMSEILGAPIGTIMSRISRARASLRAQFVAAAKGA